MLDEKLKKAWLGTGNPIPVFSHVKREVKEKRKKKSHTRLQVKNKWRFDFFFFFFLLKVAIVKTDFRGMS